MTKSNLFRSLTSEEADFSAWLGQGRSLTLAGPLTALNLTRLCHPSPKADLSLPSAAGPLACAHGVDWLRLLSGIDITSDQNLLKLALARLPQAVRAGLDIFDSDLINPSLDLTESVYWLRVTLHSAAGERYDSALGATIAAWRRLLNQSIWTTPPNALNEALQITLRCRLGETTLTLAGCRNLQPGDVLRLQNACFDCAGLGHVQLGPYRLAMQLHDEHGETLMEFKGWENAMDHANSASDLVTDLVTEVSQHADHGSVALTEQKSLPATPPGNGAPALLLDQAPLSLHFELGQVYLSVADAAALQVGQALRLANPAAMPRVRILVAQSVVGCGELVEVDGQLAVQIAEFSALSGSRS
jgi:type III secretion system YscQ/HrcQ family protein